MAVKFGASTSVSLEANASIAATASAAASFSLDSSLDLSFGMGIGTGYKTGQTSSCEWKDSMRPMSFKGVIFPVTQVKNDSGRKLVKHVYPYRPGQEIVDLGRQALTITASAVFSNEPLLVEAFGKDLYPGRYEKLLAAIHEGTSGELVHPVFGTLKAACERYNDTTQTSEINTVRLELTFVEDDTNASIPYVGTAALDSAALSASKLDAFAVSAGVDLEASVGLSFGGVVSQMDSALSVSGKAGYQVAAELELAQMNLEIITGALPTLENPVNISAKAELVALNASLSLASTDYLAGTAPVISYIAQSPTTTVDIAKEKYQDPGRALEIEQLNSIADPLNIPAGTELKIHAY